jgi:plastocyanin
VRARRGWAAVLLAGVAAVAGLGPVLWVTALPAAAAAYNVGIEDKQPKPDPTGEGVFDPVVRRINVNDRVIWKNQTANKHTVTSDPGTVSFDSGDLAPGGSFEFRFATAGTYTYHCTRHPKMVGRVEVVDPNATTTTTAAPATTTTSAPTTTTTTAPATTTTAPPTTTTTASPRPAAGPGPQPAPPVPNSAAAPPPPAPSSSTTTSGPSTTTTTTVPPTTPTSAPPVLAEGAEGTSPPSSTAPPTTAAQKPGETGDKIPTAAGPPASPGGKLDVAAVALVSALVAVGAFAVWTLIRIRPGRI